MSTNRTNRLEALPGWTWEPHEAQWEQGFARLEAYVAGKGDCRVLGGHVTDDGYRLGQWVGVQRTTYRTMLADRTYRLEALPGWAWNLRVSLWEEGFTRLEAYMAEHGHSRVPRGNKTVDGYGMGQSSRSGPIAQPWRPTEEAALKHFPDGRGMCAHGNP